MSDEIRIEILPNDALSATDPGLATHIGFGNTQKRPWWMFWKARYYAVAVAILGPTGNVLAGSTDEMQGMVAID